MKYKCENCNYETGDKSNFNKHMNSKAHAKNVLNVQPVQSVPKLPSSPLQCTGCQKTYSSKSALNRHTLYNCKKNQSDTTELKTEIKELKDKLIQKDIEFVKKEADFKIKMLENQVKELKDLIQSGKVASTTTYNISVEKYVQQNYPDAPHLMQLNDYSVIEDDENELVNNLIDKYKDGLLDRYLGDFIISNYKKNDPSDQSIWNSDTTRLTYIIKELFANKKSSWSKDSKGVKTTNYIIDPLLNYIRDLADKCSDEYYDRIEKEINELSHIEIIDFTVKGNTLKNIYKYIIDGKLAEDILKYLAPHFHIKKDNKLITN